MELIKSPSDQRDYRVVNINGLCVLLVHDDVVGKGFDKAAAALSMRLGGFADPKEAQGLVHFLEHMIFRGSTDFADNEFENYLSEHGGMENGHTFFERTCYHFNVEDQFLHGALKRFASLMLSPVMELEAMEKEIEIVDAEFQDHLHEDSFRLEQLKWHTSKSSHPLNRFIMGNKKSLTESMSMTDLQDQLLKLHKDYFHAKSMKLVVVGGDALDTMEKWVNRLFDAVKIDHLVRKPTSFKGRMWKSGIVYKSKAISDFSTLEISWTLPPLGKNYLTKPHKYIAHILTSECEGGVAHFLKARGWATSTKAGVPDDRVHFSSIACIFNVTIQLTNSGLMKIYEIIDVVYQYLKLMAQPQKWVFDELCDLGKLFLLENRKSAHEYAIDLAENLHAYSPEHFLNGKYAFHTFDERFIKKILRCFCPRNMRVDLQTKRFTDSIRSRGLKRRPTKPKNESRVFFVQTCSARLKRGLGKPKKIKIEPWFGVKYVEESISYRWLERWDTNLTIDSSLKMPSKNRFVVCENACAPGKRRIQDEQILIIPGKRRIQDEQILSMWYECVEGHKTLTLVETCFRITMNVEEISNSLMMKLFVNVLKAELGCIIHEAEVANLGTEISQSCGKLIVRVNGLHNMILLFVKEVLEVIKSFIPKDACFTVAKEEMERDLRNVMIPGDQSEHDLRRALLQNFCSIEDDLHMLRNLSNADLQEFIRDGLSKVWHEVD